MCVTVEATKRLKMKATMYLSFANVVTNTADSEGSSALKRSRSHSIPTVENAEQRKAPANATKRPVRYRYSERESESNTAYSMMTSCPESVNWIMTKPMRRMLWPRFSN
jgi:hypothetical protein